MAYTVNQLAKLSGVSVRTLHYYDEIGLLSASYVKQNGYRFYEKEELLRLQQILFFRELEFSLEEIKKIIDAPNFDIVLALKDHKKLIEIKAKRLSGLLKTIDKTIKTMTQKKAIKEEELYGSFSKDEMEKYQQEAKERWGNTLAWKQSQERTKNWTKEDYKKVQKSGESLLKEIVLKMDKGAKSKEVQELIAKHYDGLRQFYEPNTLMYRGLGEMYVADERFAKYFRKFHSDLPQFMCDAMAYYCDTREK